MKGLTLVDVSYRILSDEKVNFKGGKRMKGIFLIEAHQNIPSKKTANFSKESKEVKGGAKCEKSASAIFNLSFVKI